MIHLFKLNFEPYGRAGLICTIPKIGLEIKSSANNIQTAMIDCFEATFNEIKGYTSLDWNEKTVIYKVATQKGLEYYLRVVSC